MKSVFLSILCLVLIFPSTAQESVFSFQNEAQQRIEVDQAFNHSTQIEPFPDDNPISGLVISGQHTLNSDSSLIRIILLDDRYNEYLVFESYSLLADLGTFSIDQIGEETILLNQLVPSSIRLEIHDASGCIALTRLFCSNNQLCCIKSIVLQQ